MSEKKVTFPYRVLVGSFQHPDADGIVQEFSRGDQVRMTEAEAAQHGDALEPWAKGDEGAVTVDPSPADELRDLRALLDVASAENDGLKKQVKERDVLLGAASAENDELKKRIAELEAAAAAAPPAAPAKGK